MKSLQVAVTHILPNTRIRRARLLPRPGQVQVRTGQSVSALDVIAATPGSGGYVLIDLRRALQIPRSERLASYLECQVGERVQAGDILARKKGVIKRIVPAPFSGRFAAFQSGQLLLEKEGPSLEIRAGFSGTVAEIFPDLGAIIETRGALIQCAWGNDRVEQGMLVNASKSLHEELLPANLDMNMRGKIVAGGYVARAEVFQAAADLSIRGLILAGMSARLVPQAESSGFPVILTEGFGSRAMNSAAFEILTDLENQVVCVMAIPWSPFSGDRPEVIIPRPGEQDYPPVAAPLIPGKTVRVLGAAPGGIGMITSVESGLSLLPNRIRAAAASVKLQGSSETVLVPLNNLDILE